MSNKEKINLSSRFSNPANSSNLEVHVRDVPFSLSIEVLAAKSATVAALLEKNSKDDISVFLRDIPATPETFDLVLKFCYGNDVPISTDNVVPLACLACHLEMDETRSKNNLISRVITFFQHRVLPSWKETIKALRGIENLHQAKHIGLFDACLDSIVDKAQLEPRHLGEPMNTPSNRDHDDDGDGDGDGNGDYRPNARRKLFVVDCEAEDLTTLPVQIYEPIVHTMNRRGVPPEYVAASVCKYAEKWVVSCFSTAGEKMSAYKRNSLREIIEAVERLLPNEKVVFPCSLLLLLLRFSILLGASLDCASGFENRIGKQLDQASVNDLLLLSCHGSNNNNNNNVEVQRLKRILQSFYRNFNSSDPSGLLKVAQLVEEYLGEVVASADINLGTAEFIAVAELAVAASLGTQRGSDGIYRAIDMYLEKHKGLTEAEKEQVCGVLDCQNMSNQALQHAAQNGRLPLRVVVQVLFVGQLHLRDRIATEIQEKMEQKLKEGEEEEEEEMEMVNMKVRELERESQRMRKEIEKCHTQSVGVVMRKENVSVWKRMKRKFGCISGLHESTCSVNKKKVHPKHVGRHD